jgi:hypothetical protein
MLPPLSAHVPTAVKVNPPKLERLTVVDVTV